MTLCHLLQRWIQKSPQHLWVLPHNITVASTHACNLFIPGTSIPDRPIATSICDLVCYEAWTLEITLNIAGGARKNALVSLIYVAISRAQRHKLDFENQPGQTALHIVLRNM